MKKPALTTKPPRQADQWVADRRADAAPPPEPFKRMTIDIPKRLHQRFKADCAAREVSMADDIRVWLEGRFSEKK